MIDHLFEGKFVSPFRTDNPRIIGQLKTLEKEFNDCDGTDPERAKAILRLAVILHGEFMQCEFCGENNLWEHAKSCPLNQNSLSINQLMTKMYQWETGFEIGFRNEDFPRDFIKEDCFMLGFGRGQAERIKAHSETDCLFQKFEYGKEEYRRVAI